MKTAAKNCDQISRRHGSKDCTMGGFMFSFIRGKNIGNCLVWSAFQTGDQSQNFYLNAHARKMQDMSDPFIRNIEKISGPKRSIKITDHFTCASANVTYCITCTLCKKLYIGETGRRLGDRFLHLHQGSTESHKTPEQKFIFQIGTLNPQGINERFSFN